MELNVNKLSVDFKRYFFKNGVIATHIFVFSNAQKKRITKSYEETGKRNCYIYGMEYTEMRNRDGNACFKDSDVIYLGVGTADDVRFVFNKK